MKKNFTLIVSILISSSLLVGCTQNYVRPTASPDPNYVILTCSDPLDTEGFDSAIWNGKTYKIKDAYSNFASRLNGEEAAAKFDCYTYVGDKIYFTAYAKKAESGKKSKTYYIGTATAPTWEDMRFIHKFPTYSYDKDYEEPHTDQTVFKDYFVVKFRGELAFVNTKTDEIIVKQSDKFFVQMTGIVPDVDYLATYDFVDISVSKTLKDFVMYDEDLNEYTARLDQSYDEIKFASDPCLYGDVIFSRYYNGEGYALADAFDFVKNEKPDEKTMNMIFEEYDQACAQKNYNRYRPSVTIGDATYSTDLLDGNGFLLTNDRSGETKEITTDHLTKTSPEFEEVAALYGTFVIYPYRTDVDGFIIRMGTKSSGSSGKSNVVVPHIFFRYNITEDKAYYIGYSDLNTYTYSVIRVSVE